MRLVYWSRNRIPGTGENLESEIAQILETSRANNSAVGVTGALMFNSGCFAQVLEGPPSAVEEVFERIQHDDRHGEVVVLECAPVGAREFAAWSMAYVGRSAGDRDLFSHIADATGFEERRIQSREIFRALKDLLVDQ